MTRADALPGLAMGADGHHDGVPANEVILRLYDCEHLSLLRYLVLLGIAEAVAQEIVQEVFLRLHRHLHADGDRTSLRAWLYRVAHNLARNEQSAARSRNTAALDEAAVAARASHDHSPESAFLYREREERVRSAVALLPPNQRECLLLRAQGMKYREIALVLELSISAVAEHVQRGLKRLKELT